jgi:hypothetical protein
VAAFSAASHEGSCNHHSFILGWSLSSMAEKESGVAVQTACCISAVSFHPAEPQVLAAGNFKGEVALYHLG